VFPLSINFRKNAFEIFAFFRLSICNKIGEPPHFWNKIARNADVQGVLAMRGLGFIRHITPS